MLELYHHGSSVGAAKVRFAMAEKGVVPDEMHYIDPLKGEQFEPDDLKTLGARSRPDVKRIIGIR